MTSSSVRNDMMGKTGPKVSSVITAMVWLAWVKMTGLIIGPRVQRSVFSWAPFCKASSMWRWMVDAWRGSVMAPMSSSWVVPTLSAFVRATRAATNAS